MQQKLSKKDVLKMLQRAENGEGAEYFELGIRYWNGLGVKYSEEKAFYYFGMAEYKGFISLLMEMEHVYLEKTDAKSVENFRKSVNNADVYAYYLGYAYQHGIGTGTTLDTAKNLQSIYSDLNGVAYTSGTGIIDEKRAIKMYQVAAELGVSEAMVALGNILALEEDTDRIDEAIALFTNAAELGNANGAYNLGVLYETDKSPDEEGYTDYIQKSLYWYQKAVELGDDSANFDIATIYLDGNGVDKDVEKAIEFYKRGAKAGDHHCITALGSLYHDGDDCERDYEKAFTYFKKGAKLGNPTAQIGRCVEQNDEIAFKWYMRAARQDYATAQFNVGLFYERGDGVKQDDKKAFKWYLKAAENGDVDAQYKVAEAYDNGRSVKQNDEQAYNWYLKAAENGHATAMHNLACCFMNGQWVERDLDLAKEWFERACENGAKESYLPLGNLYYYYEPYDYEKGLKYFELAAENDDVNGLNNLGIALQDGKATAPDHARAVECYEKAIEAGSQQAYYNLARCYELGLGVEYDLKRAAELYGKAVEFGIKEALAGLARVVKQHEDNKLN